MPVRLRSGKGIAPIRHTNRTILFTPQTQFGFRV